MGRTTNGISKQEVEERVAAFHAKCHEAGLRITPQRTAIYKALVGSHEHPSAEMVFRQVRQIFPCISLDTVNRTLLTLSDLGVAFIVEGSGDAKRFDANLAGHQHFKCVKCKRIIDFHHEPYDRVPMPKNLPATFAVLRTIVYVEGVCDQCCEDND